MDVSNRSSVVQTVKTVLAASLSCAEEDLLRERVSIHPAQSREGRLRFPIRNPSLTIATMGSGAVVACSRDRFAWAEEQLGSLSRGQLFSAQTAAKLQALVEPDAQFMAGPDQKYVCSAEELAAYRIPEGVRVAMYEDGEIASLYRHAAFTHALGFRADSPRPDRLAAAAEWNGKIVGIAGASEDCEHMWQIGVDVLPECQGRGIGQAIVGTLTKAILAKGIVPYYSTEVSNLRSRQLAVRLGFWPAWVEMYAR
ncbi:GNAT family N-acetyltransferase [Paenibacillus lycopersici]|uniref:GNAT family N-acetyltransferase n=1 Tax=Paenibacillus lycopersici TaxID=2704462 RepID=A0A6C0G1F4_9BACL|nr:GNAT family N-acetyltransferase [Paenibacillus lycopersici]QHT63236.1 GNAT family N-acetyltransferase [Paenibacillus lycopersici]